MKPHHQRLGQRSARKHISWSWSCWELNICCHSLRWFYKSRGRSHLLRSRGVEVSQLALLHRDAADVHSVISLPLIFGKQITAFSHASAVSKEAALVSLLSWQRRVKPLPTYGIMNRNLSSYRRPYPPSSCTHRAWTCKCVLIHGLTQRYFSWSPSEVAIQAESWNPDLFFHTCSHFPISQKGDFFGTGQNKIIEELNPLIWAVPPIPQVA